MSGPQRPVRLWGVSLWPDAPPPAGPAELLAATRSDPFVRSQLRGARRLGPAWSFDGAVGWMGIDAQGRVRYLADVRHVSGLATRPECRGHGLGTAVTGWLTRRLLAEFDLVTLGVYADNPVGLRLYDRLGYAADHHFTSGLLHRC